MKIKSIVHILILLTFFSCGTTTVEDKNETTYKSKEDSFRLKYYAHKDSVMNLYDSIKIPLYWNEIQIINRKTIKSKDKKHSHQKIDICLSTEPEIDIGWSVEGKFPKSFIIKSIINYGDSTIFYTSESMAFKSVKWVFKYYNKEKTFGTWSIYNTETKSLTVTGKYASVDR